MSHAIHFPCYLANRPLDTCSYLDVHDKYTGELSYRVSTANPELIDQAISAAQQASAEMAKLPAFKRQQILTHCVERFRQRAEELAKVLCVEAGKTMTDSRTEVARLIDTFRIAAEESVRIHGEVQELEINSRNHGYSGMWKRFPIGPCAFISPFNFPLNLAAHKIAPAIAAGCPFVLKPSSLCPVSAILIGEVLAETDLPEGAFSILPSTRNDAAALCSDPRIKLLSFTGSPAVGWKLKQQAGAKKVVLELGGNAACVVDFDSDLNDAVQRILSGAFYQSGQSCISVQRIIIHSSIYHSFRDKLVAACQQLVSGDPKLETTFIGPLISESEALRLESWIKSAIQQGATLLCGGLRQKSLLQPCLLEDVNPQHPLVREEAFGPVAVLSSFDNFDQALAEINDSPYGLQAGIFTRDIYKAQHAWNSLEVGSVIIGDVPSWRADNMPYGGVKNSGCGREGLRYAIQDMCEIRNFILRTPPS